MNLKKTIHSFGLDRRDIQSWTLYDWANSGFATTMMAAILPIYFFSVAAVELPSYRRTAYWGYTSALALAVIALISPFLGTLADIIPKKKFFVGVFTAIGVLSCFGLSTVQSGEWPEAMFWYSLGTIGFCGANIFYESILPHLAVGETGANIDCISAAGYSVGYLGGGLLLALQLLILQNYELFQFSDKSSSVRFAFFLTGIWWLVFSLPFFFFVSEPKLNTPDKKFLASCQATIKQLRDTFREIKQYRHVFLFLVAFWLYSDGIGTVMKMATSFGKEIGIDDGTLIGALLAVQFLGIPFTLVFGLLASRIGVRTAIIVCLLVYVAICIFAFNLTTAAEFWVLAVAVSAVQGGSQALSRSYFASMIPIERSSEFFGFFSISSKFAGILGPIVFALSSEFFASSRLSILSVIIFFVLGILLLLKLRVPLDETREIVYNSSKLQ
jgi:UMF1 family MFS transporter